AVTLAYADAARRHGVTIEQGVEVTAIQAEGSRVSGVNTTGGAIDAPVVVNAAGLWSPRVARLAGVDPPIVIGRHPVFIIERGATVASHRVYLDLAGGSYARPETGGLTLTGSLTDDETEHPMDPELLGAEAGFEEASAVLERTGRALPRLADAPYRSGYAGAFDITPHWMPILDATGPRGFLTAARTSGPRLKPSPPAAHMPAALLP